MLAIIEAKNDIKFSVCADDDTIAVHTICRAMGQQVDMYIGPGGHQDMLIGGKYS